MESMPTSAKRPAERRNDKPGGSSGKERLIVIDAVRACALFGVLLMNLRDQSGLGYISEEALAAVQGPLDRALDLGLEILVDKKLLSAFSFLFGLSFTLLLSNKNPYTLPFLAMYGRRLLGLALFGLMNIAFFYWADILLTYAALGGLLLLFVRLPQPAVLASAVVLILGAPVVLALLGATPHQDVQTDYDLAALAAFGSPSWLQSASFGLERYFGYAGSSSLYDNWDNINIFGLFLLGLWAGRKRIPQNLHEHRVLLRRIAMAALPLGLVLATIEVMLPRTSTLATLMLAGTPILAIGYIAAAALVLDRPAMEPAAKLLSASGRLALTNYLLYGLVGQIAFYGWALGWIGHADTLTVILVALVGYGTLLMLSRAWLGPFKLGPAEWAWRCLTKFEMQEIRRAPAASPARA